MEIVIVGSRNQGDECRDKFGERHNVRLVSSLTAVDEVGNAEVVMDFIAAPGSLAVYGALPGLFVFIDASIHPVKVPKEAVEMLKGRIFGFCGLRSLINREVLEIALIDDKDLESARSICEKLKTEYKIVTHQAGMVTPRILCMIINEAYLTLQEGTATREDIDLAMKLGTNYPYGPFEWAERIGLKSVVEVLNASRIESGDPRYEVCELLTRKAKESVSNQP